MLDGQKNTLMSVHRIYSHPLSDKCYPFKGHLEIYVLFCVYEDLLPFSSKLHKGKKQKDFEHPVWVLSNEAFKTFLTVMMLLKVYPFE